MPLDGQAHGQTVAATLQLSITTALSDDVIIASIVVNGSPILSVTSPGLVWQNRAAIGRPLGIELWWAPAIAALTSELVTIVATASGYTSVDLYGVNGAANINAPFDLNAALPAVAPSGGALISTTANDCFCLGTARTQMSSAGSGAGWTKISGANFLLSEYQEVSVPQTNLAVTSNSNIPESIGDAIVLGDPTPPTPPTGEVADANRVRAHRQSRSYRDY